jgi:hypothetical protein
LNGTSTAHAAPRDTTDIPCDARLIQSRVDDADAWCADPHARGAADIADSAGLVEPRIAHASAGRTDTGSNTRPGGTDPRPGVTRRDGATERRQDSSQSQPDDA